LGDEDPQFNYAYSVSQPSEVHPLFPSRSLGTVQRKLQLPLDQETLYLLLLIVFSGKDGHLTGAIPSSSFGGISGGRNKSPQHLIRGDFLTLDGHISSFTKVYL
jgi:hypothetical protein